MHVEWTERLSSVVLPALIEGATIYTGFGELHPGQGIPKGTGTSPDTQDAITRKPIELPNWQVYLGAKPNQPALRFLQLIQKVRNPVGSATMVYPTRSRDEKLGVPLIVPLGEGLDTPSYELHVARELLATIMFKPVKVIALGRVRFFTTTSPWSISEPIVMEVYSEVGQRIWTNPFIGMTLEEAIVGLQRSERFQTKSFQPAPRLNQVMVNRQEAEVAIRSFIAQGISEEEIKSRLALTQGIHPMVADRLVSDLRTRKEYPLEVLTIVRECAERFEPYFEGELLLRAIAEASGQALEVVSSILGARSHQQ